MLTAADYSTDIGAEIDQKVVELGQKVKGAKPDATSRGMPRDNEPRNFDMGAVAQMIQSTVDGAQKYGRKNLFSLLRDRGVLWSRGDLKNVAKRKYIEAGYFHTAYVTKVQNGITRYYITTFVTPNGLSFIADIVEDALRREHESQAH